MNEWIKKLEGKLNPSQQTLPVFQGSTVASVLVPIGFRSETMQHEILMTKRSETVETHKGQVSFPGGLFETQDEHYIRTALRETFEEVGISEDKVQILGGLSPVKTLRDVVIFPWVAQVEFPEKLVLNPEEVERTLFLPIQKLLVEGLKPVQVPVQERGLNFKVSSVGIYCEKELIWGASAQILNQLFQLLK